MNGPKRKKGLFQIPLALMVFGLCMLPNQSAMAQTECGSLEQVAEQIAGTLIPAPFGRFGPWGSVMGGAVGLELTESPGDMVKRCFEESMGEEPLRPVDDPRNYPGGEEEEEEGFWAWLFGDPHLKTIDGRHYDFQGAGDYVLLRNSKRDVEVQARFTRLALNPEASYSRGLAVRVGDRVITLYENGPKDSVPIVIDGQPVAFLDGGTYTDDDIHVQRFHQWYMVRFQNGLSVATVSASTIRLRIPVEWAGELSGLLGNGDGDPANDIARRDGRIIEPTDTDALYGGFLDDWLATGNQSLFKTDFDVSTLGPIRPTKIVTLESLPKDAVAEATRVCGDTGLQGGPLLEGCIFDVALTGDTSWAYTDLVDLAEIPARQAPSKEVNTIDRGVLELNKAVTIPAAGVDRRMRWSLGESDVSTLFFKNTGLEVVDGAKASICTAQWSMLDAEGTILAKGSLCIADPRLQMKGAVIFEVNIPAGIEGGFVLGATTKGILNTEHLGERKRYDGKLLSPGQIDSYRLRVEKGGRLLLMDPEGKNNCGIKWSVLSGETQLFKGASCFATEPIEVPGGEIVTVKIDAGAKAGPYSIEIVRVPEPRRTDLLLGAPLDATIDTPGAKQQFEFNARAGDQLVLAGPNKNCKIVWRIFSFSDKADTVFEGPVCFDTDAVEMPGTGRYVLEVDGKAAATGKVSVTAFAVPAPRVETLRFGERLDATITTPGERVQFTFDGLAGEKLTLTNPARSNKNCSIVWRIIGPDAKGSKVKRLFEGSVCFDSAPVTLKFSGPHVLEIAGRKAHTGRVAVMTLRD